MIALLTKPIAAILAVLGSVTAVFTFWDKLPNFVKPVSESTYQQGLEKQSGINRSLGKAIAEIGSCLFSKTGCEPDEHRKNKSDNATRNLDQWEQSK